MNQFQLDRKHDFAGEGQVALAGPARPGDLPAGRGYDLRGDPHAQGLHLQEAELHGRKRHKVLLGSG